MTIERFGQLAPDVGNPGGVLPPAHVVVVCDLGPKLGIGHAMRCTALAEEFARRGAQITFVADARASQFVRDQLAAHGFAAEPPPTSPEALVKAVEALSPTFVVIDSYVLPESLYENLSRRWPTLAVVDGDPGGRVAQVYLDQNLGAQEDSWALPAGGRRLAGLEYALIRDEIVARRPSSPTANAISRRPRVLAVFGGTDAFDAGPAVLEALAASRVALDLTLVAGNERVRATTSRMTLPPSVQLDVIDPTPQLPDRVLETDVVVSASGTSSWELLCLGAACAMVCVADNQVAAYERMVATGAVVGLGRLDAIRADPRAASEELRRLLTDGRLRDRLRATGWRLVDGSGKGRVVDVITQLGASGGSLPC